MSRTILSFVAIAALLVVASAYQINYSETQLRNEFGSFVTNFNRVYASPEETETRYQIFRANYLRAMELNRRAGAVAHGVTQFSDKTPSELRSYLNFKPNPDRFRDAEKHMPCPHEFSKVPVTSGVPDSFDWRDKGAVTPVRDQGQCGSCWAFSAVEQVESAMLLKYGKQYGNDTNDYLSTQQVVDCDVNGGDYGCNGGDTVTAYAYMIKAGGLQPESTYPYKAVDGTCKFDASKIKAKVTNWEWALPSCQYSDCSKQDENKLGSLMAQRGPASICVAASNDWFSYTGPAPFAGSCNNGYYDLNHCIQLVGLKNKGDGSGYWIARNSWGTSWGAGGFIYLKYGGNACGVADEVTFVSVA